jgi:hypothetical protein
MTLSFGGAHGRHVSDLLPAYHNGTLDADDRMRVRAHLDECATCRTESNEWAAIATASGAIWNGQAASRESGARSKSEGLSLPLSNSRPISIVTTILPQDQAVATAKSRQIATSQHRFRRAYAPAALLVVILAVLAASFGLQPPREHTDNRPSIPAVRLAIGPSPEAGASPVAVASSPDDDEPAGIRGVECSAQAGDLDRIDLTGPTSYTSAITPPNADNADGPATSMPAEDIPTGTPASATEIALVTETVEQFIACSNASEAERASSLFTNDYWRRRHDVKARVMPDRPRSYVSLAGQPQFGPLKMPSIENVIVLPDGRIGAELQPSVSSGLSYEYFIFANEDGTWRIDEAMHVFDYEVVTLTVDDNGFSQSTLTVPVGKTELQLTNTGSKPHSMVASELHLNLEVAPGETATFLLVYSEATIPFSSTTIGDTGPGFSGDIVFVAPTATPQPEPNLPARHD